MERLANLVVPLIVALVSVALTAFVTIKVKFARDEKTAVREVKRIFSEIAMVTLNLVIAFVLFREFTSQEPVTRIAVFRIVFYSIALFTWAISYILRRIVGILELIITHHVTHHEEEIRRLEDRNHKMLKDESKEPNHSLQTDR